MKIPLLRKTPKQVFSRNCIRGLVGLILLLLFGAEFTPLMAEGSKELSESDSTGYRMFLDTRDPQQLKVYANVGETINVGASHVGLSGGFIVVIKPNGDTAAIYDGTGPDPDLAIIFNRTQELAGPGGADGYVPGTSVVQAGEEGIWTVIYDYPSYVNSGFTNILNNLNWTRAANQPNSRRVVLAWDITVTNTGGQPVMGRVYSNEYISLLDDNSFEVSPTFYVLTEDGYEYEVDISKADPFRFPISSNSLGLVSLDVSGDTTLNPIYKSLPEAQFIRDDNPALWNANSTYLYEPQAEDNGVLINNKLFFNRPNPDMPATATVTDVYRGNTHSTWLIDDIEILTVSPFYLGGFSVNGLPCPGQVIEFEKGGFFYFETNIGGSINLMLDINNNGSFDDPVDVTLNDVLQQGLDSVFWDGNDGLGNPLPVQNDLNLPVSGSIRFGEIHIALTDVEGNNGGVTFNWLNDPTGTFPTDEFYYDHFPIFDTTGAPVPYPISGGGTPGNALPTTVPFTYPLFAGNDNYLDQWSFIGFDLDSTFTINIVIDCPCANGNPDLTTTGGGEVCDGDDVTLTATNSTVGLGDLTYVWSGPNGFSFNETIGELETSTATVPSITSAGNGAYTVIASNANDCADTMTIDINVNPLPDINGINGGGSYCAGDTVTLTTSNITAASTTVTNYTWTGPNGLNESGSVTGSADIILVVPNVTEAGGGTYSITMTTDDNCEGGPFTVDVVVNPTPVLTSNETSLSVCENDTVQFCATNITAGVGIMTCTWTGPNGFFAQEDIGGDEEVCLELTGVDQSLEGTYTLVCTFNGCDSDPLDFTLDVQPSPEINGISPSGDFCVGDDVTFTAQNVTVGTGDLTYIWVGPAGDTVFQGTGPELGPFPFTITGIQLNQAGTYSLTLITSAGCESVPQTTTINVLPAPIICNVTGGGDACVGQDVTLSAFNCAADVLPVTWTWTGPGGVIGTNTASDDGPYEVVLTNVQVSDSGTYCIDVSSIDNGCDAEQVCVELVVLPNPPLVNITPDSSYCPGSDVVLTAMTTLSSGTITYTWTGPNGDVCTDETVLATEPLSCTVTNVVEGDEGIYILTGTSDAGCAFGPDTVQVTVFPSAEIVETSGGGQLCDADTLFLNGSGMGTAASVDYEWLSPSGEVVGSGTTVPVTGPFTGIDATPEEGDYVLTITTPDGCTDSATENVSLGCTPIAEIQFGDTILCELDTIALCGRNLNPDCGIVDYTWVTPSGITIVGTSNGTDIFCDTIMPLATFGAGTYQLFISSNGCTSLVDEVEIDLLPNPVISEVLGGGTYCEGDTAKVYFWNTNPAIGDSVFVTCNLPDGTQTTQTIGALDTVCIFVTEPGFVFCSFESFGGCVSDLAGTEVLFTSGFELTATSNSPVCSNETLELDGSNSASCSGDANYQWIDPVGNIVFEGTAPCEGPFPASVPDPISGDYCLVVFADSSSCTDTACVNVEVFPAPEVTIGIDGGGEFCEGEQAILTATIEKEGGGDIDYVWTFNGTAIDSGTAASGDEVSLDLGVLSLDDDGEYCLELTCPANGCTNDPPSCVTVTVSPTPDITDIEGEGTYCEGVDVPLNASGTSQPGTVTYTWDGPNYTFTDTAPCGGPYPATIPNIGQDQSGEYTLTLTKDSCEISQSITIIVNPTPIVTLEFMDTVCAGQGATLTATIDPNGANSVDWNLTGGDLDTSGTVTDLTVLVFTVISNPGTVYTLTGTSDQSCEAEVSTAEDMGAEIPTPTLSATPNPLCPGDELTLTTDEQAGDDVAYCWLLDGELLATTTDPVFVIPGAEPGAYSVQAKVDGCDATSDPVTVTYYDAPDAVDDAYEVLAGEDLSANATDNDSPNTGVTATVISGPSNGSVTMNSDGTFTYTPNNGFAGEDEFTYQICLVECPELCDEAVVRITVNPTECIVPNIITPNGDGTNDILFINCVPPNPNNSLRVFNRWGDEIYSAEPYRNDWDGSVDGEPVPAGTYFYLFYPDRSTKDDQKAGYIKVVR